MKSSLRYYSVPGLNPEDYPSDLPQIVLQPDGTAFADPAAILTGRQWPRFTRRLGIATPADPDFDLPVTFKYLGLVFTARRTTDWMQGVNAVTGTTQQSVYYVAFNFKAARRVLAFKARVYSGVESYA